MWYTINITYPVIISNGAKWQWNKQCTGIGKVFIQSNTNFVTINVLWWLIPLMASPLQAHGRQRMIFKGDRFETMCVWSAQYSYICKESNTVQCVFEKTKNVKVYHLRVVQCFGLRRRVIAINTAGFEEMQAILAKLTGLLGLFMKKGLFG